MGASNSTLKVTSAPKSANKTALTITPNGNAIGSKVKPDAKRAEKKHLNKFFKPTVTAHTPNKIYGNDSDQFTEMFDKVEIKNDDLVLAFPSQTAAEGFRKKVVWPEGKAIVLNNTELRVKIRAANLAASPSYKAVINSIVTNTAYEKCKDFITAIQFPGAAGDEKQNQRIIAVLNVVGIWSRGVYGYRKDNAANYDAKKFNYDLSQAAVPVPKQHEDIIKADQILCAAWNQLSSKKFEVIKSEGCLECLLRHAH